MQTRIISADKENLSILQETFRAFLSKKLGLVLIFTVNCALMANFFYGIS